MKLRLLPVLAVLVLSPLAASAADMCALGNVIFDIKSPFLGVFGLALLVLEFFLPTKGFLGVLGVLFFILGSSSLIDNPCPDWQLSLPMVVLLNVVVLGSAAAIAYVTFRGYTRKHEDVINPIIGRLGHVVEWTSDNKRVDIDGVIWLAHTHHHTSLTPGQKVIVTGQNNLTLLIKPHGDTL